MSCRRENAAVVASSAGTAPKTCRSISARHRSFLTLLWCRKKRWRRCQKLFLSSLWALPVLRPVNTGYWQEGDKAKRLTRVLGRRRFGEMGRIGGLNQAGEGPAPEWSGWSGSSIRGRAAGRHIVRRGPEDHDRHTLISTQPCAISTHTIVPSYLAFLLGLTFILSYPHTWLSYLAWYSYSHTLISTQPCALHIVHSSISTHTLVRSYLTFILGLTWITAYSHTQPCAQFDLNSYSCTLIFANHSEMCWFSTQPTCTPIFFHFHTIHALVQKLDSGLAHLKPLAYNDNQTSILYWQTILIHFNVKSAISRLP